MSEIYTYPKSLAPVLVGFRDGVPILRLDGPDGERPDSQERLDEVLDEIGSLIFPHVDPEYIRDVLIAEFLDEYDNPTFDRGWIEVEFTSGYPHAGSTPQFIVRWED